jgi:hypothetical protein
MIETLGFRVKVIAAEMPRAQREQLAFKSEGIESGGCNLSCT